MVDDSDKVQWVRSRAEARYEELLGSLHFYRELRGVLFKRLSDDMEAWFAAKLDECWWEMTDEEQARAERLFGHRTLSK